MNNIIGKKVSVGVAFMGGASNFAGTLLGGTKYFEGVVAALTDRFLVFTDGSMIGVQYIQIIQVIG